MAVADGVESTVNLVDEVTQFEHVGAVAGIAESFLIRLLEEVLAAFGFHEDNASRRDAPVRSTSTTPSRRCSTSRMSLISRGRARRPNDNALVEGKNASVVRKWLGHDHTRGASRRR